MNTLTTTLTHALPSLWVKAIQKISLWQSRNEQRQALSHLTPDQLCDMGLNLQQIRSEQSKMFWQGRAQESFFMSNTADDQQQNIQCSLTPCTH